MSRLVIYGKSQCPQCESLKVRLDSENIPYTYLLLNIDYGTKDLMEIKPLDVKTFPVPFIENKNNDEVELTYIKPNDITVANELIVPLLHG